MGYDRGPAKVRVKVLEGVFGKVVRRIGPIIAHNEVMRVQAIVELVEGGTRRTAHLIGREGHWFMCLLEQAGEMLLGEVAYDGR